MTFMFDNLHILHPHPLYPETTGGSLRTLHIARLAQETFRSVSVFTADENNPFRGNLNGISLYQEKKYQNPFDKMRYYAEGLLSKEFYPRIPEKAFDKKDSVSFQVEGPFFYNILKKKNIRKYLLDQHNVYWEMHDFPYSGIKEKIYYLFAHRRDKKIEVQSLQDATHILVCSERDKEIFIENVHSLDDKITVIPNCINFSEYENYLRHYTRPNISEEGFQIVFTGLLSYGPNLDAAKIICQRIAPHFGDDVNFLIVGRNPPNIQKPKNVTFSGYIKDVKSVILRSDICIAPLRYGSGTRLKILEYFALGKPVVSTSKGAEGIDYLNNKDIIIENDFNKFPARIRDLLENATMRIQLGENGKELVRKKYDWPIYQKALQKAYETCFKS